MAIAIKAAQRSAASRGALRQLRQQGQIPGVVYGKALGASTPIAVDERELLFIIRSHPNAVLELDIAAWGKHAVMIAEVQRDSLSNQPLHVDFHQINMNENVRANVRIELTGDAVGVGEGGLLQTVLHEAEVQCLPGSIPEALVVDISHLAVGDSLLAGGLTLPAGVELKSDPQQVVATVLAPRKEREDEADEESGQAPDGATAADAGQEATATL